MSTPTPPTPTACEGGVGASDFWGQPHRIHCNGCAESASLRERLATAEAERDAYRKAKAENDERFMTERDQARADAAALREQLAEADQRGNDIETLLVGTRHALGEARERVTRAEALLRDFLSNYEFGDAVDDMIRAALRPTEPDGASGTKET